MEGDDEGEVRRQEVSRAEEVAEVPHEELPRRLQDGRVEQVGAVQSDYFKKIDNDARNMLVRTYE